jgi:hypothetical protein
VQFGVAGQGVNEVRGWVPAVHHAQCRGPAHCRVEREFDHAVVRGGRVEIAHDGPVGTCTGGCLCGLAFLIFLVGRGVFVCANEYHWTFRVRRDGQADRAEDGAADSAQGA